MPSSKNYKRDYAEEWKDAKARGEGKDNATRHRARYAMEKAGKVARNDGKDVGHVVALGKGGTNAPKNLRAQSVAENRSFSRTKTGSMKSEISKRESRSK